MNKLTMPEIEMIEFYYEKGKTRSEIAILLKRDPKTIGDALKKYTTYKSPKKSCDEEYFKNIDTEEKAYLLGFLTADGCINNNHVVLSSIDFDIILKFKTAINFVGNTQKHTPKSGFGKKDLYIISVPSKTMCKNLANFGIIPNKTHHTFFPEIKKELQKHFIRGVVDGDGCINKYHFSVLGNHLLISEISNILVKECNLIKKELVVNNKNTPNIVFIAYYKKLDIKKIIEYLYKDSTIYLERKFEKAKKLM